MADTARAYDVLDGTIARYRRGRAIRIATASALAVVAVGFAATFDARNNSMQLVTPASGTAEASLPRTVDLPPIWTQIPTVHSSPAGPAALIFSGSAMHLHTLFPNNNEGNVAVVGARRDTYRKINFEYENPAGQDSLLSPDGSRIVYQLDISDPIRVLDLRTGETSPIPGSGGEPRYEAVAWSPDGRALAVVRKTHGGEGNLASTQLAVMDIASGRHHDLPGGGGRSDSELPAVAAFSRDGKRLAYQTGNTIRIADRDGKLLASFGVAGGARLGGKGAWSPDGQALATVRRLDCCPGSRYPVAYGLHMVNARTGAAIPERKFPLVRGITALRVLGWRPGGQPVVVAFFPEPEAARRLRPGDDVSYANVRRIEVLALRGGARSPELLLTPPDQVLAIDVADHVISSGLTRPGSVAPWYPLSIWALCVAAEGVAVLGGLAALFTVWWRRRRAERALSGH